MMTKRQQQVLYAMLDRAAGDGSTLQDIADRLGLKGRGSVGNLIAGLKARGLYGDTPRPTFNVRAFKFIRFGQSREADEDTG